LHDRKYSWKYFCFIRSLIENSLMTSLEALGFDFLFCFSAVYISPFTCSQYSSKSMNLWWIDRSRCWFVTCIFRTIPEKLMRIFIYIPLEWNSIIFSLKSYMSEVFSMKSTKMSFI
jgi:hypothetical protein